MMIWYAQANKMVTPGSRDTMIIAESPGPMVTPVPREKMVRSGSRDDMVTPGSLESTTVLGRFLSMMYSRRGRLFILVRGVLACVYCVEATPPGKVDVFLSEEMYSRR